MDKNWLAEYFVKEITQRMTGTDARIERALAAIVQLENKGWTLKDIKNELDAFAKAYPGLVTNIYHMEEIMANKQPPSNLMEKDVFYYHNRLRKTSKPVRIYRDKETGSFIRQEEKFFLEMKDSFTMKDLLEYWYDSNGMKPTEHNLKQDKGKFEYILGFYDIDEVLFMIDIAQITRKERMLRPLLNAFEIEKSIEDARKQIREKRNVHRLQGIDRIVEREV